MSAARTAKALRSRLSLARMFETIHAPPRRKGRSAAPERDDGEMGRRRAYEVERQRVAVRGLRVEAEDRVPCRLQDDREEDPDGVEDDERRMRPERRAHVACE